MNTIPSTERVITELDHARLSKLLVAQEQSNPTSAALEPLQDLLTDANVVPSREVQNDIVTLNAQLMVQLPNSEQPTKIVLCYPAKADPAAGMVSVLSPMGLALVGLSLGQTAQWRGPTGQTLSARVEAILFQPEASGDFIT